MRMEVFSRIRRAARENHLDSRAEKIVTNFARMFKQNLVNHAFSKWRVNTYTYLVNQMNQKQLELAKTKVSQEQELKNME